MRDEFNPKSQIENWLRRKDLNLWFSLYESDVLIRLNYSAEKMVADKGFEPLTFCLSRRRSATELIGGKSVDC